MRNSAGFGAHTENTKCWRVIDINRRFSHFAHSFTNLCKVVVTEIASTNIPAVNASGIGQHAVY